MPDKGQANRIVEVKVSKLVLDETLGTPVVVLKEVDGERLVPIWIGPAEAHAITLALERVKPERPLTHDLLKAVLDGLGAEVLKIVINELKNNTFFARIVIRCDSQLLSVDARPSDSIALALRTGSPIYVAEDVIDRQRPESTGKQEEGD